MIYASLGYLLQSLASFLLVGFTASVVFVVIACGLNVVSAFLASEVGM